MTAQSHSEIILGLNGHFNSSSLFIRFKLEKKRSPGKQQDEADRNRYSVISQTKAEVEMLKIETLQTNENGHAVDKQAKVSR